VHVHARAVVAEEGLGHEGRGAAVLPGGGLDDVLVDHHLVRHRQQRAEAHVDLGLPGGADLVVLDLDFDAHVDHGQDHLAADVLVLVHRRDREIPLLVPGPVPPGAGVAGAPDALRRVDVVVAFVGVLVEPGLVQDVELELRTPVRDVGHTGGDQAVLGLLGDVARVPGVGLPGDGVLDEAVQQERRLLPEGIQHRGGGIRHQEHVRLVDGLEPPNGGSVEAVAILEAALGEFTDGHREVLHDAGQIAEP